MYYCACSSLDNSGVGGHCCCIQKEMEEPHLTLYEETTLSLSAQIKKYYRKNNCCQDAGAL